MIQCNVRDLTERLREADAAREGDERFRLLVQGVDEYGTFLLDGDGNVATWNAGAERIKGYKAHEIIGRNIATFFPPADVAAGVPAAELRTAAEDGRWEGEGWRVRADGSRFWANVLITALRDPAGRLRGYSKLTRDVSERRRADDALRESEGRLRAIVDTAVDGIITIDEAGRVTSFNPAAVRLFGYAPDEVTGQNISRLMPVPHHGGHGGHGGYPRGGSPAGFAEIIGSGRAVVVGLRKDGSTFPMDLAVGETVLGDRRIYTGIVRDVTAREAADAEVRLLGQAMEDAVEGIARLDPDGRYVSINAAYAAMVGRTRAEMAGLSGEVSVHPDDLEAMRQASRGMLEAGKAEAQVRGIHRSGVTFSKHVTLVAIRRADGSFAGSFHFTKDVTDRKRADEELRRSQLLLAGVLDGSLNGVLVIEAAHDAGGAVVDFVFRMANPAAARMLRKPAGLLLGGRLLGRVPPQPHVRRVRPVRRRRPDRPAVRGRAVQRTAGGLVPHRRRPPGRRVRGHVRRHHGPQAGRGRARPARDRAGGGQGAAPGRPGRRHPHVHHRDRRRRDHHPVQHRGRGHARLRRRRRGRQGRLVRAPPAVAGARPGAGAEPGPGPPGRGVRRLRRARPAGQVRRAGVDVRPQGRQPPDRDPAGHRPPRPAGRGHGLPRRRDRRDRAEPCRRGPPPVPGTAGRRAERVAGRRPGDPGHPRPGRRRADRRLRVRAGQPRRRAADRSRGGGHHRQAAAGRVPGGTPRPASSPATPRSPTPAGRTTASCGTTTRGWRRGSTSSPSAWATGARSRSPTSRTRSGPRPTPSGTRRTWSGPATARRGRRPSCGPRARRWTRPSKPPRPPTAPRASSWPT